MSERLQSDDAEATALDAAFAALPFRGEWLRYPQGQDEAVPIRPKNSQMPCLRLAARHPESEAEASESSGAASFCARLCRRQSNTGATA